ncbi:hypothetical protein, conserved [Leishmania tarentolae]|uniref:KaiC-like domain-containing protein n=1 Tax=Leishmania tarentolae TaxID=5689 RepID=A0A640KMQ8_LEITA|nr:hypothetical protein, conserved [Leishmania tarentolae]
MSAIAPASNAHKDTGSCAPCHASSLRFGNGDEKEKAKGVGVSVNKGEAMETLDPLRCFTDCDVVRGVLAAHLAAPAFSSWTEKGIDLTSALSGAPPPSAWKTERMQKALVTLMDRAAGDMDVSRVRHGQGEFSKNLEGARSRLCVDTLLLHLTAEGPSLRAALRRHRGQLQPIPPQDDTTTQSESRVYNEVHTSSEEDEALAILTRCVASVALANRNLGGIVQEDTQEEHTPASSVLQTCTALSLLRSNSLLRPRLPVGVDHMATSGTVIAATDARTYWCSTGCTGLDQALGGGGFRSGWVTEVYGEAGTGKTQLGLQCLLQQAATDVCYAAVALALANNADFTSLAQKATKAGVWGSNHPAVKCMGVFDCGTAEAARCAVVYLVSEDVPTSRLGPLAAAAVERAVRSLRLHSLINQLPSCVVKTVWDSVENTCTVPMVLSRLQIRHVTSVSEVLRLLEPLPHPQFAQFAGIASPNNTIPNTAQSPRSSSLIDAVRVLAGSHGRAVVVLDSIAAAVVAGQWNMQGVAQPDATVATLGLRLRLTAMAHNWCIIVTNQVRAIPTIARQRQCALARIKRTRSPATSTTAFASLASRTAVPALGFSWASAPHCRVLLRKSLAHGVRQLVLHHAPSHPPAQVSYVITEHGIEDA